MMDKAVERQLLRFCAAQQADFNPGAWRALQAQRPQETLCAMLMLSKARWYGRLKELGALVQSSLPAEPAPSQAVALAQQCGFDRARFAERLREQMWFSQEPKR
jgi:hypothetical protein